MHPRSVVIPLSTRRGRPILITQFEEVGTCERLSVAYLIPVLGELLRSFPFIIRGFHTDNGSEYINKRVAALLHHSGASK
jgi:hypothetical protein